MISFPGGAKFAFTILDDTDVGTLENLQPTYRVLTRLGLRTTKTVWVVRHRDTNSPFAATDTLERPAYRDFVLGLRDAGFEVTWHGPAMESSRRSEIQGALEIFRECFGHTPRIHVNHAMNRENMYWGEHRFEGRLVKAAYRLAANEPADYFCGHVEGSEFWWGDVCRTNFDYIRNFTFRTTDVMSINPTMPYFDAARPLANLWFSTADAEDCSAFNRLLEPRAQDRLVSQGGACIVSTHFGKGFVKDGVLNPETRRILERIATLPGWFPTVGELLDWLKLNFDARSIPKSELFRMERRWAMDAVRKKVRGKIGAAIRRSV